MNKKVLQIIAFTSFTISFFFGVLFVTPSSFIFAESIENPVITSINPSQAKLLEQVEIIGSGFLDFDNNRCAPFAKCSNVLLYGSSEQTIVSWSSTRIVFKIDNAISNTNTEVKLLIRPSPDGQLVSNTVPITIEESCAADVWTCSSYGQCQPDGTSQRECTKTFDCEAIDTPKPNTTEQCIYVAPPCSVDIWSCSDWGQCSSSGIQTRTCIKTFDCPTAITPSPITTQGCTPPCSADTWSCGEWSQCSSDGTQNRSCTKAFDCPSVYTPSPSTFQYCTPPPPPQPACTADTWTCGVWGECSLSGIQSRSCSKTFDCPSVETAPPTTVQYCEVPNRPQQVPQDSSNGILNQDSIIKSTVKLLCPVDTQRASQGSGTVIDPSGVILTNKHVIAGTLGCLVGFINDFNDEPYFGERQIADIFKVSSDRDIAVLKIRNPQNKTLTSIDITRGNSNLRLGTKVSTYGFPAKFGTKITYTSGDFSGTDGSYLKTTAILEYGNSGGGAYLKDGTFIGVPSAVVKGELNALGYILSINTINAWLGNLSIVSGGTTNNQYSRVSVLEDIDLETLDSLKLFIPQTDVSGNLAVPVTPATSQKTQKGTEQPQPSQTQKESTVIESADSNKETSTLQQDQVEPEKEQPLKVSWVKRLFLWLVNLFNKIKEII